MKRFLIIALAIVYVFGVGCASQQSVEDEEFSVSDSGSSDASLDDFESDSGSSSSDSTDSSKSSDQASDSSSSEKDEFSELENDASKSEEPAQAQNDTANQQQAQQQQVKDQDEAALEDELNKISQDDQQQQQAQQQPQDQQTQQQAQNDELSLDDPQQQPQDQQQQQQAQQQPEQMPEQVIADQQQQQQPPPEQQPPVEQTPPPVVEAPVAEPTVEITGLKYKANDNGGTILIEASGPITYTSRKNEQLNQVIIEVDNVILPAKFMRTLNTKDMVGTIGAIDAYQNKDSKIARFVVQLRGTGKDLAIQQEGNSLLVVGEGPMAQNVADAGTTPSADPAATSAEGAPTPAPEVAGNGGAAEITDSSGEVAMSSDEPLQAKTLEEFLTTQHTFTGKKISIEMQAPVLEVIKLIMDESGANIIIDESVGKVGGDKISFKLREIPWDQALVTVLKMKGLAYSRVGNVLRITRQEDLENEQKKLDDLQQTRSVASFKVKMFPLSYSKPAEMKSSISEFITKDKGKALVDNNTNSLIVTDSEDALSKIEKVIKVLDVAPAQVLIEAKIVEADESFSRNLGVRWGFNGNPTEVSTNKDGQIVNLTPNARFAPNLGTTAVGNLGFTVGTLDMFGSLDASLSLGEQEDLAKVVSSPRIVTVNNKPATISQNNVVNFVTTSATTGAGGSTPTQTVQQINAPLNLDVTPIVSNDGFVTMDISFKRNTMGSAGSAPGALPPVQERNLKSSVIVKDGQTTVIGGIFNSQQNDSVDGVPGLKDVPFLGALFRGKTTINKKNELLIFVTPKILSKFNLKGTSEPFVN